MNKVIKLLISLALSGALGLPLVSTSQHAVAQRSPVQTPTLFRLGMIGLDTSHVIRFAELLNDPTRPDHVPGARIVAAYKAAAPM